MNKRGQSRSENNALGYVVIFLILILLIYLFFKIILVLGIILTIIGIIIIILGANESDEQVLLIGIVVTIVGVIAFTLGIAGVSFFEGNPVGSSLLNTSKDFVNSTASIYNSVQNARGILSHSANMFLYLIK